MVSRADRFLFPSTFFFKRWQLTVIMNGYFPSKLKYSKKYSNLTSKTMTRSYQLDATTTYVLPNVRNRCFLFFICGRNSWTNIVYKEIRQIFDYSLAGLKTSTNIWECHDFSFTFSTGFKFWEDCSLLLVRLIDEVHSMSVCVIWGISRLLVNGLRFLLTLDCTEGCNAFF